MKTSPSDKNVCVEVASRPWQRKEFLSPWLESESFLNQICFMKSSIVQIITLYKRRHRMSSSHGLDGD
jgi:hypothetical protein